ncbi:MAG: TSUP family transporter [Oscillospiraceae bacterium]|nr:TSUP family transporter [Oscillospiraceae bacterium]
MYTDLISIRGLLCCLAFFFAGIVDSISGGGGLITIPVMLAAGIPVHYITGTNQCSAWLGTGVAAYKFWRGGQVHLRAALYTLPFAVVGSFCGARLNLMVPERWLTLFMLGMVPVIALLMLFDRDLGAADRADGQPRASLALRAGAIGLVLGAYQGFYGPGSGLFFVLAYAALVKLSLVRATGTTRFVLAIASVTSVLTYAFSGMVLWRLALAATAFNVAGSYLGAALAIKKGGRLIRPLLFGVVALLLVKLAADALT